MNKQSNQKLVALCIARDVMKNLWVALAIAFSLACLCLVGARIQYSPTYTSSTTFVITRKGSYGSAYSNMTKAYEIIDTFQTVVNSQVMEKRVIEEMGVDTFPGTVRVQSVPETNLMTVSATASRPDVAFRLLQAVRKVYPDVGNKVLGEVIMEVFEKPQYSSTPDNPFQPVRVLRTVFAAVFVGMVGLIAFLSYLRDTVKTSNEVRQKLDTSLFGVVYHERQYRSLGSWLRRKRKHMLLSDPSVSFLYEETLKKLSTKLLYRMKNENARVVMITSTLPGEGKSTLAMNLAQDMAHRGKRVLLVDGDLKHPGLARVLKLERNQTVGSWGEALEKKQDPTALIRKPERYGFQLLLNKKPLPQAPELLAAAPLRTWIGQWLQLADVVIIDAPPVRRRADTEIWARCSDLSLLVVRQNQSETKYVNDSIDMLEGYGSGLLGCIYNDATKERDFLSTGYGYGTGSYGRYGAYGSYGRYGAYGAYGRYDKSRHGEESHREE